MLGFILLPPPARIFLPGTAQGGGIFLSTNSGENWTAVNNGISPYASIYSLAVSGSNIFAGTDYGVYLSANNGASWTGENTGLIRAVVSALAVSGTNLFAGEQGGGVYLSTNNGTSWTAANDGLNNLFVNTLLVSGTNLYAGTSTGLNAGTSGSVWRRPL